MDAIIAWYYDLLSTSSYYEDCPTIQKSTTEQIKIQKHYVAEKATIPKKLGKTDLNKHEVDVRDHQSIKEKRTGGSPRF